MNLIGKISFVLNIIPIEDMNKGKDAGEPLELKAK